MVSCARLARGILDRRRRFSMEVWVRNDCDRPDLDEEVVVRRVRKALSLLDANDCELSVWLCDDGAIRELHGRYLGDDTPTNVISFAQREGEFSDFEPDVLGDVVVSVETAARDAAEAGTRLVDEVTFLLLHGLLHLLGYDHEGEQSHRAPEMEAKEEALFAAVVNEA